MARIAPCLLSLTLLAACSNQAPSPTPPPTTEPTPAPPPAPPLVKIERETPLRESSALVLGRVAAKPHAFVADEDDRAIVELDLETNAIVATSAIGARPRDLLLLADGRLVATLPDEGTLGVFDRDETGTLREAFRVKTPAEPLALGLSPDDATLYVTTGVSHSLVSYAMGKDAFEERSRASLGREPRAVLATAERIFVTHVAETFVSIISTQGGKIELRDIGNRTMCGGGHCSGARTARGAQAIARVGERGVVVPAAQALPVPAQGFTKGYLCPPRPTFDGAPIPVDARTAALRRGEAVGYGIGSSEAGPPITFDLETLDAKDGALYGVGTPAPNAPSCLLPRAATAAGNDVLVACLGSGRIVRYHGKHGDDGGGVYARRIDFDFSLEKAAAQPNAMNGTIANVETAPIAVPAGPSAIAVDKDTKTAFVWSILARSVTRVDLATAKVGASVELPRRAPRDEAWLAGRALFFTNGDKRISADGRTCANCHLDGRDDGLTWKTPDGMRRTRMLAGQTSGAGPFGWKGSSATLDAHVKTTIKNLEGTGLPDKELSQLATYVASLAKLPGARSNEEARGRELFSAAECANCHSSGGSDRAVHDVGTGGGYLTPTLAGVATRGQLMHDGRYKNLDELLASATAMGRGASLSPDDRQALVKYLETL